MDCRTTSTRASILKASSLGMTLMEVMIATALGSIVSTSVAALVFYSGRTLAAMANYVELDGKSRLALDTMSREIRQANRLTDATLTSLTFEDYDGGVLSYIYDPEGKTLKRYKNGQPDSKPLLEECFDLSFSIFQRNPIGGTYEQFSTGSPSTCKLVQLRWICSRKILGVAKNTESVQSAKIVIRKQ